MKFSVSVAMTVLVVKHALSVLFFRLKQRRTRPSHSVKLMGGGGFRGSSLTTLDSTLGGGRKLLRPTFMSCDTLESSCTLVERRQYISSPGLKACVVVVVVVV